MSYVPIRVSTLRGDQPIDFDVFIKINNKYVLYLRRGDSFEGVRLLRLKEKRLKKMFITPGDEVQYRKYLERNIEMAFDPQKALDTRVEIIQGSLQSKVEDVFENHIDPEIYEGAKATSQRFVEFIQREILAFNLVINMENVDQNIAQHGVSVASIAIRLAEKIGITDPKQLQLLSLGAALHDLEHFNTGQDVMKPLEKFSPEELAVYKQHPINGARRVQDKKHFDQTVLNIIIQHEEYMDGRGFPQGLKESKIDPLALIVGSANKVDRLLTFEKIPRNEISKHLVLHYAGCYPLQHLQFLGDLLKT